MCQYPTILVALVPKKGTRIQIGLLHLLRNMEARGLADTYHQDSRRSE